MSKKFKTRGVVAVAVVAALVAVMAPSAMADTGDVAKAIAVAKTGSSGRDLVGREVKGHGVTVSPAKSKDGKSLRTLVQDTSGGVAALAVLEEGQSSAVFHGMLPAGSKITPVAGGDHQVLTPDGTKLTIKAPWARDAAGKSMPTSYTFAAGQITQNVDITGATFPVVADPTVTFGVFTYVHFQRDDVLRIHAVPDKATKARLACGMLAKFPPVAFACGLAISFISDDIETTNNIAFANGGCMLLKFTNPLLPPGSPIVYVGSELETC